MNVKYVAAAILFSGGIFGGVFASIHPSSPAIAYFDESQLMTSSRIPAAVRHDLDFSKLAGAELLSASQKRLISAATVILQQDQMGIELGHFVLKGASGRSQLACDYYDQVTMTFVAEGIADSGEKPTMEIVGPCRAGADMTRIEPIWVPVTKILSETATDKDLSFDDDNVHFHFTHMAGQWPKQWSMISVQLANTQDETRHVDIEQVDIHDILAHPFVMNWQPQPAQ